MSERDAKSRLMEGIGEVDDTYYQEAEYTEKELEKVKAYQKGSMGATESIRTTEDAAHEFAGVNAEMSYQSEDIGEEVRPQKKSRTIPVFQISLGVMLAAAAILLFVFFWNPDRRDVVTTSEATTEEATEAVTEATTEAVTEAATEAATEEPTTEEVTTGEATTEAPTYAAVSLDSTNFPDDVFREYLSRFHDKDRDGVLSSEEIAGITSLSLLGTDFDEGQEIHSLKGLEHFPELRVLICSGQDLGELDVSRNTALRQLECRGNHLTELDVSNNPELHVLNCLNNHLNKLDVSRNTALTRLDCSDNPLGELDVSRNTALTTLKCVVCGLTELDLSANAKLTKLSIGGNYLEEVDLSWTPEIEEIDLSFNYYTTMDLSMLPKLKKLYCVNSQLVAINLRENTKLEEVDLVYTNLVELDLSNKPSLSRVSCYGNSMLTSLNVSGCPRLTYLDCQNCALTTLNVSGCDRLTEMYTDGNNNMTLIETEEETEPDTTEAPTKEEDPSAGQTTAESVTEAPAVVAEPVAIDEAHFPESHFRAYVSEFFDGNGDGILSETEIASAKSINIPDKLPDQFQNTYAWMELNKIEDMRGLEYFPALEELSVAWLKSLTTLNVSHNPALKELDVAGTGITEVDIRACAALEMLDIEYTSISQLDLSGNPKLKTLIIDSSDVDTVDVSNNPELEYVYLDPDTDAIGGDGYTEVFVNGY